MRDVAVALATMLGADARKALAPELILFGVIVGKPRHGSVVVNHATIHIVADEATAHAGATTSATA
jgi:hypothetical protein